MITLATYCPVRKSLITGELRDDSTFNPLEEVVSISELCKVGFELVSSEYFLGGHPKKVSKAIKELHDRALNIAEGKYDADYVVVGEPITLLGPTLFFRRPQLYLQTTATMYIKKDEEKALQQTLNL